MLLSSLERSCTPDVPSVILQPESDPTLVEQPPQNSSSSRSLIDEAQLAHNKQDENIQADIGLSIDVDTEEQHSAYMGRDAGKLTSTWITGTRASSIRLLLLGLFEYSALFANHSPHGLKISRVLFGTLTTSIIPVLPL